MDYPYKLDLRGDMWRYVEYQLWSENIEPKRELRERMEQVGYVYMRDWRMMSKPRAYTDGRRDYWLEFRDERALLLASLMV